ncbi:lipoate--protein ligase family protein [bacterium]|nr:MAG: lipoate--protein ligase family protein [bacterium]
MNKPGFLSSCRIENLDDYEWNILVDPHLSGGENMERDRLLLKWAYCSPDAKPILRFFMWNPPAISIGFMQSMNDIDTQKCSSAGIDVVCRPTGGRAIFHHTEFTYSVTIPPSHPLAKLSVLETYNEISLCLAHGLQNLGIKATLSPGNFSSKNNRNPSCFSSTSRYELVVNGKKIVGSAQRRKHNALLQQGSIMTGEQYIQIADFLTVDNDIVRNELLNHSTYIEKELGYIPSYEDFTEAIIAGFKKAFRVSGSK